jgi:hypothetical protein
LANKWTDSNKEYNGLFFSLEEIFASIKGLFVKGRALPSLMLTRGKPWSLFPGARDSPEILKCGAVDRV